MYDYNKEHLWGELWRLGFARDAIFAFARNIRAVLNQRLRNIKGAAELPRIDMFQAIEAAKKRVHEHLWNMGYRSLELANLTTWAIDNELWVMLSMLLPFPPPLLSSFFNQSADDVYRSPLHTRIPRAGVPLVDHPSPCALSQLQHLRQ